MTAQTMAAERPKWLAGGAVVLAVVAVGFAVVQPFAVGPVGFDSAASVAFFDRIVGGQRLEAYVGTTPKPLLTFVYGLLYNVTHDWRAISWATIGAFAVGTLLAARLIQRVAGLPAAVFAVIGLVGLSLLQSDLILSYATPWAMVGWFAAGLLVTKPQPRFGLAGIALMLAALARLETLALAGCAIAALLGLWALHRWAARDVAGRLIGRDRARRLAQSPGLPRRAWLLALAFAALPIMLVHDGVLTADPLYWAVVSQDYSRAHPASVLSPLTLARVMVRRYDHQVVLSALAAIGGLALLREAIRGRQQHIVVAVGVIGLGPGVGAFLLVLAARGTYVSTRYFAAIDVAVVAAAAIGVGAVVAWLLQRSLALRVGTAGRVTAAVALGVAAAIAARPLPAPLSSSISAAALAQRTLDHDADMSLPVIRAALDQIPRARDYPPAGVDWETGHAPPAVLLGPGLARPRLAVDLGLPLSNVAGLGPTAVVPGPAFLGCASLVLHDRSSDLPLDGYAILEIEAPVTIGGDVLLTPLIAEPAAGYWLLKVQRSGAAASACGEPAG
ncbi:MAG TPA: hypothetical protein VID25_04115 [Candidatus Limnocylindrales bacterium]